MAKELLPPSGTTATGIINRLKENQELTIVNVLKNIGLSDKLEKQVRRNKLWTVENNYHFGGFAKVNRELIDFCNAFYEKTRIKLDPIYNGKMAYACMDLIDKEYFKKKDKILLIHTGGLQGIDAYNYVCKNNAMKLYDASS